MAKKDNNNILYITLLLGGLLLLLIPFFIFDLNGSTTFFGHLGRFGLHILAFGAALVAGSLLSVAVTKASSSVITMKVVAVSASVVVGAAITYNTIQTTQKNTSISLADTSASVSTITPVESLDSTTNYSYDTNSVELTTTQVNPEIEKPLSENTETTVAVSSDNNTNTTEKKSPTSDPKITTTKTIVKDKITTPTSVVTTPNKTESRDQCNSFQVLQGSQLLDRKLGLSIYDPNKMIRFNNDCGCVLKDANMSVRRDGKILEQKLQSGNYVNWRGFKDINTGDKLEIEIKQANCKDTKGLAYLYSFPKPILTIIFISDHLEFEGADAKNSKTTKAKEPVKTAPEKIIQKDKVEEDANKFGN